ncbi:MAG: hypothetical protein RLN62_06725 [Rickettsiales bacterium]
MSVIDLDLKKNKLKNRLDFIEELIPYIKNYDGETIVIYVDDVILTNPDLLSKWANDVVLLKRFGANPIIVHSGEKIVEEYFKKFDIEFKVDDGVIITDDSSIKILEMILKGKISSEIVSAINDAGGSAVGISGKDGNLIEAKKFRRSRLRPETNNVQNIIDFGFNGKPSTISPEILLMFEDSKSIPVISSIAIGENAETFYINPIVVGSVISASLVARMFVIMSDIKGLVTQDGKVNHSVEYGDFQRQKATYKLPSLMRDNIAFAFDNHVEVVRIIDAKIPHSLLLNLFTDEKVGSIITQYEYN